mmetsp:Transcript_15350/g.40489  ORF Transcript_15350/g.40489 Transcript_15350/m.40489 type:complete len:81 (-) Transcript_15350:65-307(-)
MPSEMARMTHVITQAILRLDCLQFLKQQLHVVPLLWHSSCHALQMPHSPDATLLESVCLLLPVMPQKLPGTIPKQPMLAA